MFHIRTTSTFLSFTRPVGKSLLIDVCRGCVVLGVVSQNMRKQVHVAEPSFERVLVVDGSLEGPPVNAGSVGVTGYVVRGTHVENVSAWPVNCPRR